MQTFTMVPRGPFSLAASIKFLEGFTPASYAGPADGVLELAFPAEGSWRTVGVRVGQEPGGDVTAEIVSPAEPGPDLVAEVRPQVERILSLDVDGSEFPAVGERDPVVGEVQRRYPGLRPARPPPSRSARSARTGAPTGPGSRCCCAPSWSTRPGRSPAGKVTPGRVKLGLARGCV